RRARARWPREVARPSLTAAAPAAQGASGRGRKTALQPNRKTLVGRHAGRTTHALQTADIFTRHRQDAARRARARWPREVARPSLTAAAPAAQGASGRGRKTALQPNRKTLVGRHAGRTTHALQTADIFTRHRQHLWRGHPWRRHLWRGHLWRGRPRQPPPSPGRQYDPALGGVPVGCAGLAFSHRAVAARTAGDDLDHFAAPESAMTVVE